MRVGEEDALEEEDIVGWLGEFELVKVPPTRLGVEEGMGVGLTEGETKAGVALGVATLEGVGGRGVEVPPPGGGENVGWGGEGEALPLLPSFKDMEARGESEKLVEPDTLRLDEREGARDGVDMEVGVIKGVPVTPPPAPPVVGVPREEMLGEEEALQAGDGEDVALPAALAVPPAACC